MILVLLIGGIDWEIVDGNKVNSIYIYIYPQEWIHIT